eukprot:TRINITY_DN2892_c0_g1_i2.p1 TRINITY_DN2892_c0_g1~~TRINITY_DN2892_c0_g1_i2.p1  ORF type:complete len:154 (+),score=24.72 TRINITY_DN2892_c0_g1_i2:144-605(+)
MMTALRPITLQDGVFDLSNQRHPKNLPMMTGDAVTRLLDGKEEEIVELDLTINRLKKLENLDKLVNLELLCLRTNHISRIENLEPCGKTLQHLDMYENRITVLEHLATICPSLTCVAPLCACLYLLGGYVPPARAVCERAPRVPMEPCACCAG